MFNNTSLLVLLLTLVDSSVLSLAIFLSSTFLINLPEGLTIFSSCHRTQLCSFFYTSLISVCLLLYFFYLFQNVNVLPFSSKVKAAVFVKICVFLV